MNIWLVKIWVLSQTLLDKQDLSILHWQKFLNRGLKDEDKKEGLVERVKNTKDKNEELLKAIRRKTDIKSKIDLFDEDLDSEAIALIKETKIIEENVDYDKLSFTGGNKKFTVLTVLRHLKS